MRPYTIGMIGAGRIGTQVARAVIKAGHPIVISNSRGPQMLADLVQELGRRRERQPLLSPCWMPERRPSRASSRHTHRHQGKGWQVACEAVAGKQWDCSKSSKSSKSSRCSRCCRVTAS